MALLSIKREERSVKCGTRARLGPVRADNTALDVDLISWAVGN